jgi:transposase
VRHTSWAAERVWLVLSGHRWKCYECGRQFRERFPGILKAQRATEAYREHVFRDHWDGINRSRVAAREGIGSATVERHCLHFLERLAAERSGSRAPQVLGIDEHFFSRRQGYATTLCDLKNHRVFDVVLGRSEASLEGYLNRLSGKEQVRVVCMDLAPSYRALVRKHFPQARIVADRFHVIRLVNHHFLACWRELDPTGSKHRGLVSLMRRHRHNLGPEQSIRLAGYLQNHPAMDRIYRFKQRLSYLLVKKHRTRKQCEQLIPRFLRAVY